VTHDGSTQTRPLADDAARGMPRLPLWATSLTLETGLLHMIARSDHFREWWGYGVFGLIASHGTQEEQRTRNRQRAVPTTAA
jgi:hypothetical protein